MVDVDRIRGLMAQHRLTQADVAKYMGVATTTLQRKLRTGNFDTDECEKLIDLLDIKDPTIFFRNIAT